MPTPYANRCEAQRNIHTYGHLSLSCFGCVKISGFRYSKTSANKRLLFISLKDSCKGERQTHPPTFPSVNHFDCKGSEIFWIKQKKMFFGAIFCSVN